ncbi:MAG: hypothetical protein HY047_06370 [Acidobacteria bacterium]|nr:hypothetical protein [Acidobacteriota bacterium]
MLSGLRFTFATLLLLSVTACVYVPLRGRPQYRREQYFANHRELSPTIANAIETGHVVPGMDREQVWVVVGDPVRKSLFAAANVEVWLYPSVRFHQDPAHSHGASSFRLVFIDGILRIIEPI